MKSFKLYNVFFPIWFLIFFPSAWIVVIALNFFVDSLVVLASLKFLKIKNILQKYKKVILKVFLIGFLSDLIGSVFLIVISHLGAIGGEEGAFAKWFEKNVAEYIMTNPFGSVYAFIVVLLAVMISGVCIYYLNLKISFSKLDIDEKNKRKMALCIAIFTAPYLFLLPISLLYSGYKVPY